LEIFRDLFNLCEQVGELLSDERRINVAITRAKSKLILIGSSATLHGNKLLGSLVDHAGNSGNMITMPEKGLVEGCPAWAAKDGWAVYRKLQSQKALC
jgi:superfamily I DNA and/or RNA helicase